jgi:hypothetical protein
MHVAHATGIKSATIFVKDFSHKFRLTQKCNLTFIECKHTVKEASAKQLFQKVISEV